MLDKTKNSNTIKFLEDALFGTKNKEVEKVAKREDKKENFKVTKSQKLDNNKALSSRNGGSFLYAGDGFAQDGGSPTQYLGKTSNNSIWDSEVLSKLSNKKGGDEIIKESKKERENIKNEMKNRQKSSAKSEGLNTDTSKTIKSSSFKADHNYNLPRNSISIFDSEKNFSRVPEKTEGEKLSETHRNKEQKDKRSMYTRTTTTSQIFDKFLSNLVKK